MKRELTKVFFCYQMNKTKTEIKIINIKINYYLKKFDIKNSGKKCKKLINTIYKDMHVKYSDIEKIINNDSNNLIVDNK